MPAVLSPIQSAILQLRETFRLNSQSFKQHDRIVLQRADGTELVIASVISDGKGGVEFK